MNTELLADARMELDGAASLLTDVLGVGSARMHPQEMQGGRRRNVYIDDASWEKAVELGNGNASDGIRIALARTEG